MIIKLIEAKTKPKDAVRRARYLVRYLATADRRWLGREAPALDHGLTLSSYMSGQPEATAPTGERVLFKGASINGTAQDWDKGIAEVERRLAGRSAKVKKPIRHAVLSLRRGEGLSEDKCIEGVAILAAELGCEPSAILWAAHGDTDNFHLHIMFVTVDAEMGEAVPFGRGAKGQAQWKEAMQRAIARIEASHQLQPETGSRYRMEGENIVRNLETAPARRKRPPIPQERLDWEAWSGFVCFTRYAQDVAGPILDEARSWTQLHANLAPHGLGIRSSVNGGELHAGDDHVKLSNIDRRHSWTQLIKPDRLGPFVEPEDRKLAPYEPRILDEAKATAWLKRRDTERAMGAQIDQRVAALFAAREAALAEVKAYIGAHRDDLAGFDGDPRLRRDIAGAWPNLAANATAAISAAFDARLAAVRTLRHAAVTLDDFDALDLEGIGAVDAGIVAPWQHDREAPPLIAIDGYAAERSGDVVRYWVKDDLPRRGQPAMVDAGAIIWVNDSSDRTIAAALMLAKERYGEISVFGDRNYLASCARVAERLSLEFQVITVAQAQRRAKVWKRQQARRLALDEVRRRGDVLRRWARAYINATPLDAWEEPTGDYPSLRDIASHSTLDRLQSPASSKDEPVAEQAKPAKSVGPSQLIVRDLGGLE